ncbi:21698_t:CDS:2 [Gigaspora margarita]|uniref:21698_t:CDS:1 n=1 Tax=Gigaspora margarita TaxID=4874 RepID=A0ABM8VV73_GIGMA|nr:21698_t:CDS:2 [Gigaspora margarita]
MNGSENENSENKKIENEVVFISEKIKEIVDETEVEVQYKISAIHDPEKISLEKIYQEIIEANKSSTDSKIPFTKKGVPMKVEKIEIPEGYELGEEEYDLQRAWFYRDQLAITKLGVLEKIEDFNSWLDQSHAKILVKFSTEWCHPCQKLKASVEDLLREESGLLVLEVDAEKFRELAQRPEFNVNSVPALFLFQDGKIIKENRGYLNSEELREFVYN